MFLVFSRSLEQTQNWKIFLSNVLTGEKKKTKAIDSELNPVWNEVNLGLFVMCERIDHCGLLVILTVSFLHSQVLEFDLKGSSLDASSFIDVVVKDYETIGKDKYVCDDEHQT